MISKTVPLSSENKAGHYECYFLLLALLPYDWLSLGESLNLPKCPNNNFDKWMKYQNKINMAESSYGKGMHL